MALVEYKFLPGIDKQSSDSGAENRWIDSDNVRFRYGLPEKVGGWSSLVTDSRTIIIRVSINSTISIWRFSFSTRQWCNIKR